MHQHLNQSDRACIAALLRSRYSYSAIAHVLGVHPSTISKEVRRNSRGVYLVHQAQRTAVRRRTNTRIAYRQIDTNQTLEKQIIHGLKADWSPDQIVERCGISSVSSIYRYLDRHKPINVRFMNDQVLIPLVTGRVILC